MRELNDIQIDAIEKKIGYRFRDKRLLTQAFVRQSYYNENQDSSSYPNEVLEFIGDAVLSLCVVNMMTDEGRVTNRGFSVGVDEGDLTVIRSRFTDKRYLSAAERPLDLAKYLVLSVGDLRNKVSETRSVREDLIESLIGAVYLDSGRDMEVAQRFVDNLLDLNSRIVVSEVPKDDKTALQEYLQSKKIALPTYEVISREGPANAPTFSVRCIVDGVVLGEATARSKKDAEKDSARQALAKLRAGEYDFDKKQ